jgi:hypothetical protein
VTSILSSTFTTGVAQVDGRVDVTETHTLDDGRKIQFEYRAEAGVDPALVMAARAERVADDLAARDAAAAVVLQSTLPVDQIDWMRRFTLTERIGIRAAAKTDPIVEDAIELLKVAKNGVATTDPDTLQALAYFEQTGLIAAGRAAEILNG